MGLLCSLKNRTVSIEAIDKKRVKRTRQEENNGKADDVGTKNRGRAPSEKGTNRDSEVRQHSNTPNDSTSM
jgi:hypothetical protein